MILPRSCGVVLHPTSLAGPHGMGTLGGPARRFVDWLVSAGQGVWQVLPLGPTGYGDSPYQSFSAFAGNPMLVDLLDLVADGLLTEADLADAPEFPSDRVDYGTVLPWKREQLKRAFERFEAMADAGARARLDGFRAMSAEWIEDYALFMALKDRLGGSWLDWEPEILGREPRAIAHWRQELDAEVRLHVFMQFAFFTQYTALRQYATKEGVRLVGDVPIFVALDSADAWSHPELFHFDTTGHPTVVAGVPPDYFSETGQLWGNPLYRWDVLARTGYRWWVERMKMALALYDIVRIDHFRGFEAYWEVPAGEETAVNGRWVKGPNRPLFDAMAREIGPLPLIAEDLGLITPEVERLRDGLRLPGMKILQFAWGGGPEADYLPHNFVPNCVAYTGTHDNDTTRGWFDTAPEEAQAHALEYMQTDAEGVVRALIRLAYASVARFAVIPMQDWLELGSEARMNTPGLASGNWEWRLPASATNDALAEAMKELADLFGRSPAKVREPAAT